MITLGETCFNGHLTIVLRLTEIHDNVIDFAFFRIAHALCLCCRRLMNVYQPAAQTVPLRSSGFRFPFSVVITLSAGRYSNT